MATLFSTQKQKGLQHASFISPPFDSSINTLRILVGLGKSSAIEAKPESPEEAVCCLCRVSFFQIRYSAYNHANNIACVKFRLAMQQGGSSKCLIWSGSTSKDAGVEIGSVKLVIHADQIWIATPHWKFKNEDMY